MTEREVLPYRPAVWFHFRLSAFVAIFPMMLACASSVRAPAPPTTVPPNLDRSSALMVHMAGGEPDAVRVAKPPKNKLPVPVGGDWLPTAGYENTGPEQELSPQR